MDPIFPDKNQVLLAIDGLGYGIYASRVTPFGLSVKLSGEGAGEAARLLQELGFPAKAIGDKTLIVYGSDPVAAIDAQITTLQQMRARLTNEEN